jgi:hypothetical protein
MVALVLLCFCHSAKHSSAQCVHWALTGVCACSIPLRELYEEQLNEYAEKVTGLQEHLQSKEGKKLSRRARSMIIEGAAKRPDMQIPGTPVVLPRIVEQGPAQLEELTKSGEWCLTIVDIKMTSTQTAQGKKSSYSAMVMVGNLAVRFVHVQHADGSERESSRTNAVQHALCSGSPLQRSCDDLILSRAAQR